MIDNVALYLPELPPSVKLIESQPGVESCGVMLDDSGLPSQYRVQFMGGALVINMMPPDELPEHIAGLLNYVMHLHQNKPRSQTILTLEKIAKTKTALGCVIDPELDEEGYIGGFLTSIIRQCHGLMFARDSIFDSDGNPIMGPLSSENLA